MPGSQGAVPFNVEVCRQVLGPLRPTYCNVPGWAQSFLYVTSAIALALFAYGIYRHWSLWRAGQPNAPERNTGRWQERARALLIDGFGQRLTMRRTLPGLFHSGIFYGFGLLFIGTVLATVDYDVAHLLFDVRFVKGTFYLWYEAVLDAAGLVLMLGLAIAGVRRYIQKPHHVLGEWDLIIWSLVFISLSGFLVEGLRLTFSPVAHGSWSWVGALLAQLFIGSPIEGAAVSLHLWSWLGHAILSLGFVALIPYTNAVHMIATPANIVMQPLGAAGGTTGAVGAIGAGAALQPIDIETAEFYGTGRLEEFNWKQRLGFDSCTRCGRCETVCPAYMSGTPLNPKQIIVSLSNEMRQDMERPFTVTGEGEVIVGGGMLVEPDALFACTTCMACVEVCPVLIEIVDDIVDMRRYLTLNEGALPGTSGDSLRNISTTGNPWGYPHEERTKWSDGLDVEIAAPGEHYEVLYWVGCSGSYDQRNQKVSRAFARLMKEAGVRFAIMAEERCTCESGRRLGDEYTFQEATKQNITTLKDFTFDRVACHCPHCFNTIKNEYSQFGGDFDVVHHTQLIQELIESGRLNVPASARDRIIFHDSCYLGRYNGEFEAPRDTLRAAGANVIEPARTREAGLCCGGGGGKMWFEGESEKDVGVIRLEELLESKPDVVSVACPYCLTMLDSAKSTMDRPDVKVMDVAEVLAASLGPDVSSSDGAVAEAPNNGVAGNGAESNGAESSGTKST